MTGRLARSTAGSSGRMSSPLTDEFDHCAVCGRELPTDPWWGRRRYCSPQCSRKYFIGIESEAHREARAGRHCIRCGAIIPDTRQRSAVYCSEKCRRKVEGDRERKRLRFAGTLRGMRQGVSLPSTGAVLFRIDATGKA